MDTSTKPVSPATDASIARRADEWMTRLTSGTATSEDFAAAREWCAQSDEHRAAFQRARNFWQEFILPKQAELPREQPAPRRWLAAAATVLFVVGVSTAAYTQHWMADFRTAAGERRTVTLADGSKVVLDSASAIDVRYSDNTRSIHLLSGQALFHVAPNPQRPFVVHDHGVTATAVGTVYSVKDSDDAPRVSVLEGKVAVATEMAGPLTITAGQRANSRHGIITVSEIGVDNEFAWEHGSLAVQKMPLPEVLGELERHQTGIIVAGSGLEDLEVSGIFSLDNPDETLATLSSVFPIEVMTLTRYVKVVHRKR